MERKNNGIFGIFDLNGNGEASLFELAAARHALSPVLKKAHKAPASNANQAKKSAGRSTRRPTSPFHSAYRAPGAKGLGELTHNGYIRLQARVKRGIARNIVLSLLLIAALFAVIVLAFSANYYDGYSDALLVAVVPVLCIAAIMYISIGVYNDVKADLARLEREKMRLSRSARARMERDSSRRTLSVLVTLAVSAAALIVLNMVSLA